MRENVAAEVLEQRLLLTYASDFGANYIADAEYDSQVIGRASDGNWWTSEFDLAGDHGPDVTTTFASWSTAVNWKFVGHGDFDGDGLSDLAGWDPTGGGWWVSLSDGIGSTTMLGVTWATNTTWSDVKIADVNNDRVDDLVGRAANGTWYAALANGDGTFRNEALVTWDANGGWRDVFVADIDGNGYTDLVGRSSTGVWQATYTIQGQYGFGVTRFTVTLDQWDETQGWHDARLTVMQFRDGGVTTPKHTIVARSLTGRWQALAVSRDASARTVMLGGWNEAANWRDVVVGDIDRDGTADLIGRTDYGQWWASTWNGTSFVTRAIGAWSEVAGWHDVYVAAKPGFFTALVGRTNDGGWWASTFDSTSQMLTHESVGYWNPAANWVDVNDGTFSRSPLNTRSFITYEQQPVSGNFLQVNHIAFVFYAHRSGATVRIQASTDELGRSGYLATYQVPATGYSTSRFYTTYGDPIGRFDQAMNFYGRNGNDSFTNATGISSQAWSLGGADMLEGRNGVYDEFYGGPGVDLLFGDPVDKLVQD
ncbi:MAG: VCBS repeat-containing protein [Planctomycetota bacterium]|nr:VCBS repeat-containing protein [Planctomycetaceae bacterium]MDQ3330052.1 VCBS repeat-containing protein [Planctomycetota bacterium]